MSLFGFVAPPQPFCPSCQSFLVVGSPHLPGAILMAHGQQPGVSEASARRNRPTVSDQLRTLLNDASELRSILEDAVARQGRIHVALAVLSDDHRHVDVAELKRLRAEARWLRGPADPVPVGGGLGAPPGAPPGQVGGLPAWGPPPCDGTAQGLLTAAAPLPAAVDDGGLPAICSQSAPVAAAASSAASSSTVPLAGEGWLQDTSAGGWAFVPDMGHSSSGYGLEGPSGRPAMP